MTDDSRPKKTLRDAVTDQYAEHFAQKEKRRAEVAAEVAEAAEAERAEKRAAALAHHRKISGGALPNHPGGDAA